MIILQEVTELDELDALIPLFDAYSEINPEENPKAVLTLAKIAVTVERGIVIQALDKGEPIGYVMGIVAADTAGLSLNVIGIYADKIGTGRLLLDKIERWSADTLDIHVIRSITRRHPEAMAKLFGAKVTGYLLEKEF